MSKAFSRIRTFHLAGAAVILLLLPFCSGESGTPTVSLLRNNLDKSSSSYLLSAAHQPVFWQEWGEEAFDLARELNRPILLDIGAVWCHWCHVMDRESYENEEIAALINENFIAIKVDRDERPDIDKRYQTFIQTLTGQGGWPLTCFLTHDGKVFFGGTYFPPEDSPGRPGLKSVMNRIIEVFRDDPGSITDGAEAVFKQVSEYEKSKIEPGALNSTTLRTFIDDIQINFDAENGGFGGAPKFPFANVIELLLTEYDKTNDPNLLEIAEKTLDEIAKGGIHDQIGGGFHRYSVDAMWNVPHFEKMTMLNAELLTSYVHLFHATGKVKYRETAEGIIDFYKRDMTDNEKGGFYAHQDADVSLDDDGSYFTWTKSEIESSLDPQQADVFSRYYGISENPGDLAEDITRNVLFEISGISDVAKEMQISLNDAESLLESAKSILLEIRNKRKAPFIEKTIFASHNGAMISAYAEAYKILGDDDLKSFALKTLDFVIENLYSPNLGFAHSYSEGEARIYGLLNDQVRMANALLDGFELSGTIDYLDNARAVMNFVLEFFEDKQEGGFFDRIPEEGDNSALSIRNKLFDDIPVASLNAVTIRVLDRLFALTDEDKYRDSAKNALEAFAGSAPGLGLYASAYALSLRYHLDNPPQVVIVGKSGEEITKKLMEVSRSVYRPGKEVYLYDPEKIDAGRVPEVVRAKMASISGISSGRIALAYVCIGTACAPPTADPEQLAKLIRTFGR